MTQILTFFVTLLVVASTFCAAACNANNCARAVTGTIKSLASARASDCKTNLVCTATPAVSTVYSTTTIVNPTFVGTPTSSIATATTRCQTSVPTYASACSSFAAYSSACSCAGVTSAATTTITTSTTTVTVTSPGPGPACNTYRLQATAGPLAGDYAVKDANDVFVVGNGMQDILVLSGTTFSSQDGTQIVGTGDPQGPDVYLLGPEFGILPLVCSIAATYAPGSSGRPVTCMAQDPTSNSFRACGNSVQIRTASDTACDPLAFVAVPACV